MGIFKETIGTLTASTTTQVSLVGRTVVKLGGLFKVLNSPTLSTAVTGIGGLDTGAIAASSFYYVYAVSDGSITGIVASLSPTSPTGFTRYKKVGAFQTNSGALISRIFFHGTGEGSLFQVTNFLSSGVWTLKPWVKNIEIRLAAGGGNGGAANGAGYGGCGGGAGGSAIAFYQPTTNLTVTVGAATAVSSVITVGTLITVASATGGTTAPATDTAGTGGIGTVGDELLRGQSGGNGDGYSSASQTSGGNGGSNALFGGGGRGGIAVSGTGDAAGANSGAGGGGGGTAAGVGGAGGTGRVVIYEYLSPDWT